ncbi:hypothetical protein [Marinicella rhabdoformis]|uniref:hypothetical protein n=1 Tax=Marinicella rhabdoformis TaxID=2580566 RepID=UPI0012AEBB12|nr:hypothetical protein [Marinicella rhabdoformis]
MTPTELKDKVFDYMNNIDDVLDNQNTLELLAMTNNQFWVHIKTALAHGVGLGVDALEKYLHHDEYRSLIKFTINFIRDLFCDQVIDKHG